MTTCDSGDHKANTCDDGEISAADAVWSHGEGDLQNTKRASGIRQKGCFTGPTTTPTIQWSSDLGGPGTAAAPVIGDDGTIYIVGEYPGEPKGGGIRNAGLMAISPQGTLKWFFSKSLDIGNSEGAYYTNSVAIGRNGTIYIGLWDSTFYALNLDGTIKWKYRTTRFFSGNPVIDEHDNVYVGMDTIFCFTPDGHIRWKFADTAVTQWCVKITLDQDAIYCGYLGSGIVALTYNGQKKGFYSNDFGYSAHAGILVDQSHNLYFKTNGNILNSIDRNGNFRWAGSVDVIGGMSEPALRGDYLYFGSFLGVYELDKKTGTEITTLTGLPQGRYVNSDVSPLIDDNGVIYIGAGYGGLSAVTNGANKLWETVIPQADQTEFSGYMSLSPDGTLYIATSDFDNQSVNRLYAIR
ncbi:PQQ-like beta-propeller repeat protein [bacterium]|nr:PQQ-like beta-propeller repeat protein [bacterium]